MNHNAHIVNTLQYIRDQLAFLRVKAPWEMGDNAQWQMLWDMRRMIHVTVDEEFIN